jgi:hypothetical protein
MFTAGGVFRVLARLPARLVTERAVRVWIVTASAVTILGLPLALWQLHDLRAQQTGRTLQGLSMVDQQLSAGINRTIRHRILRGEPLLKPQGPFTEEELSDYLDALESLADWWGQKQMDIESIDIWFGDVIHRTARHPEVRAYIRQQQIEDTDFYSGFEDLAKALPTRPTAPTLRRAPDPRGPKEK